MVKLQLEFSPDDDDGDDAFAKIQPGPSGTAPSWGSAKASRTDKTLHKLLCKTPSVACLLYPVQRPSKHDESRTLAELNNAAGYFTDP
nr:hypothetical protein Itr_chr08CG09190 [Ipomoea trifida]